MGNVFEITVEAANSLGAKVKRHRWEYTARKILLKFWLTFTECRNDLAVFIINFRCICGETAYRNVSWLG